MILCTWIDQNLQKQLGPIRKNSFDPLLIKGRVKQKVLLLVTLLNQDFCPKLKTDISGQRHLKMVGKLQLSQWKFEIYCQLANHRPRTSLMFDVFWSRLFKWIQFKIYINELKLSRRILIWDVRNTNFLKNNQKWIFYWLNEESKHFCPWWDRLTPVIPHYMHCKHLSHGYSIIHKYLQLGIRGTPLPRMCFAQLVFVWSAT